jgi:hypothetical protein
MNRIFLKCLFISLIFASCKSDNSGCVYSLEQLIKTSKSRVISTSDFSDEGEVYRDKGRNTVEGGYYIFYPNNSLHFYRYLIDSTTSIYDVEYDMEGKIKSEEGKPLIFQSGKLLGDTLVIKYFFFALKKNYKKIVILGKAKETPLILSKDTLFSNVETADYVYHVLHNEGNVGAYLYVEYENECNNEVKSFKDTTILHYKKSIHK